MENKLENKAKFFGSHYGIDYVQSNGYKGKISTGALMGEMASRGSYLLLKPLSSITDADATEVALLYGWNKYGVDFKERLLQFKIDLPCIASLGFQHRHMGFVFDYLRSKGYALPWMGLSVDTLIEYGWIKINPLPCASV